MHFIEHFVAAAILFAIIDSFWLRIVKKIYEKQIGDWLLEKPDLKAGAVFYILYVIGIVIFAIDPALGQKSFSYAIGHGALFGLVAYATYHLTNKATLKKWSWQLTLPDLAWGTFLTTATSAIIYLIFK